VITSTLELVAATDLLDLVTHQVHGIYWVVDLELRILQGGGAVEDVLGSGPHYHVGKTLYEVHDLEGGSVDPIEHHKRACTGESVHYDTELRDRMLSISVAPHIVDGKIVGAVGTAVDVTTSRMFERRMVDAQRAESLGVLAGGLAHDFNNLLVAILGNADLALRETPINTNVHGLIENIRSAALRSAELTDQLLAYAGRGGLPTTRLAPAPLVAELLRISQPSLSPNTSIVVEIPADLIMRGDPSQIRQVLLNLVGNAREALGERGGTITMTGSVVRLDGRPDPDDVVATNAGMYVMLEVADDGPGIDRDARRRVFEPFFTTKSSGSGLGLASVVGIVRAHGGGLRLVSSPGRGARFQVMLPSTTTPVAQEVVGIAAPLVPATAPRTVLVIDDEDLVRDVVARMIEDLGYAAITAADGQAGLAVLDRHTIDAVLVDMTMPAMSGIDVISAVRARQPLLPVVLCSGYDRARKGTVQADAYLPKPFRLDTLEQTLTKLLGNP
jgi:two-component system cell cycle sensor histidine kinase/response regulator CckA